MSEAEGKAFFVGVLVGIAILGLGIVFFNGFKANPIENTDLCNDCFDLLNKQTEIIKHYNNEKSQILIANGLYCWKIDCSSGLCLQCDYNVTKEVQGE